jgi:hypothetical protein
MALIVISFACLTHGDMPLSSSKALLNLSLGDTYTNLPFAK